MNSQERHSLAQIFSLNKGVILWHERRNTAYSSRNSVEIVGARAASFLRRIGTLMGHLKLHWNIYGDT